MSREPADVEEDRAEWEQDIGDELEEMRGQADEDYQRKMERYEEDMRLWREQKLEKVSLVIAVCTLNAKSFHNPQFNMH